MLDFLKQAYGTLNKKKLLMIFLVFFFILVDVICGNFLGSVYNEQYHPQGFWILLVFVILQILCAPFQAGLSDHYGRKKSLIVSLSSSLLSLFFIFFFNLGISSSICLLIFSSIAKGVLGNTLPIALAVLADIRDKNYRLLFVFSTAAYAIAYFFLSLITDFKAFSTLNSNVIYYLITLFLAAIILCIFVFSDPVDKCKSCDTISCPKMHSPISFIFKKQTQLVIKDIKDAPIRQVLLAFFLWELSLYSILLSQVDFQIKKAGHLTEWMMSGYLIGAFILVFCYKIKDKIIIKFGYYISFLSPVPYFIFFKLVEDQGLLIRSCYFFHALGNAFLSPALLSILAKEMKSCEQGRIYGLTDSVDTSSYLFATIVLIIFNILKLELIYLISFSFLVFAISWIYYNRFQKIKE